MNPETHVLYLAIFTALGLIIIGLYFVEPVITWAGAVVLVQTWVMVTYLFIASRRGEV